MAEEVRHYQVNQRYRIVIERVGSSTKQIDGFKVEANGDDLDRVEEDAGILYNRAMGLTDQKVIGSDPRD
tara:strand:- start:4142 stop:4351 length:210 start_codon:yes stop_codon:yes gene_type:complete